MGLVSFPVSLLSLCRARASGVKGPTTATAQQWWPGACGLAGLSAVLEEQGTMWDPSSRELQGGSIPADMNYHVSWALASLSGI